MRAVRFALFALFVASACGDARSAAGTGIYLEVSLPEDTDVDQLRVTAQVLGGAFFAPLLLPETATMNPLAGAQTVRLDFDDALAGAIVELEVEGLWRGEPVTTGTAAARLEDGVEVDAFVLLR